MDSNVTVENLTIQPSREIPIPRSLQFWLLLCFEVPSLACSLFVTYSFIADRTLRSSLQHHTIIMMNIFAFLFQIIDVPLYLNFTLVGKVWLQTPATCLIWWLADLGFYYACCILVAWTSIERHIFIFYDGWLSTYRGRFFAHYLPLLTIMIYLFIYYTWVIFFPPCENTFNYMSIVCTTVPCYLIDHVLGRWEAVVHGCFVTLIVVVCSISLLIRVIIEKHRHHHVMHWRRHRKLTIQLLLISSIFLVFNLPLNAAAFFELCGLSFESISTLMPHLFFLTYWLIFLIPFACLNSLPNLADRIKRSFGFLRRHRATVATSMPLRHIRMVAKQ